MTSWAHLVLLWNWMFPHHMRISVAQNGWWRTKSYKCLAFTTHFFWWTWAQWWVVDLYNTGNYWRNFLSDVPAALPSLQRSESTDNQTKWTSDNISVVLLKQVEIPARAVGMNVAASQKTEVGKRKESFYICIWTICAKGRNTLYVCLLFSPRK